MKKFKTEINISLREGILDVQGKTVEHALHSSEFSNITDVKIGRLVKVNVEADNYDKAMTIIDKACQELIANPIIEDYSIQLEEI